MAKGHQDELFRAASAQETDALPSGDRSRKPLAVRMRPKTLADIVGQDHLTDSDALLPRLIEADTFGSLLFYGPPGCGKTSMAQVIAGETGSHFVQVNAVLSNVAELRDILRLARYEPERRTILFIDEIHRFNKAQQDLLLPDVEAGNVRLIGATTHNPGFYVIPPLVSRSHLFRLEPLTEEAVVTVLRRALEDDTVGLKSHDAQVPESVLAGLARLCDGDLRRALNALETLVLSHGVGAAVSEESLEAFARERRIRYDANEDEHYDTASAFIKSMRGGDPDAALYWMVKMLAGGEDPRFIARRMVILASEDIGLADSRALLVANAAFDACERIGLPECELNLAHACIFLATSPKSNSSTEALSRAKRELKQNPLQSVPLWIRDGHGAANRQAGHAKDYQYSHEFPEAISGQEYMLTPKIFYQPKSAGSEAAIRERLERWKQLKVERNREDS